ncbi:hypothetical protein RB195_006424 [Necator americanus]|uniref:Uncharacterized protein n=1 Tax=Necator americanus TaxID=51031 RepID=A0ABR1BSJ9_NECAM
MMDLPRPPSAFGMLNDSPRGPEKIEVVESGPYQTCAEIAEHFDSDESTVLTQLHSCGVSLILLSVPPVSDLQRASSTYLMIVLLLLVLISGVCFYLYKQKQVRIEESQPTQAHNASTRTALVGNKVSSVAQTSAGNVSSQKQSKNVPSEELRRQVADLEASTPSAPGPLLGESPSSGADSGSSSTGREVPRKKGSKKSKSKTKSGKKKKKKSKRSKRQSVGSAPGTEQPTPNVAASDGGGDKK